MRFSLKLRNPQMFCPLKFTPCTLFVMFLLLHTLLLCSSTVHEITIEVTGPAVDGDNFSVRTIRCSPTSPGLVTSTATQDSFYSSMTSKLMLLLCVRTYVCVCACVCTCVRVCLSVCLCALTFYKVLLKYAYMAYDHVPVYRNSYLLNTTGSIQLLLNIHMCVCVWVYIHISLYHACSRVP